MIRPSDFWTAIVAVCLLFLVHCVDKLHKATAEMQATLDQTVDFLSDLHAERAKPQ